MVSIMSLPMAQRSTPVRPLAWSSDDGVYTLAQLVHPLHILEEGILQNNCMRYLRADSTANGKIAVPPEQADKLLYWTYVKGGAHRYYSFCCDDAPLVTIELQGFRPYPAVTQIRRKNNRKITGSEYYFSELVQALTALYLRFRRPLLVMPHITALPNNAPILPAPPMSAELLKCYRRAVP